MPVALLNYLDRQMLASMKTTVMGDIPSIQSDQNWGIMLGLFKWVYAIVSLFGGFIADRFSRRFTICTSLFVWSAVTWWTGHVGSYSELLWARSLMGISEAFYIPAALALIADYHSADTRSRAVSFHQMAISAGVIIGGFGGYVAESPDLGWRVAFDACGVFGMLYALPLVLILRDAPIDKDQLDEPQISPASALRELLTNRSFLLLASVFTLAAIAPWVIRDWGPAIVQTQFKIPQGQAGLIATIFWQTAAIVGAMVGGYLADLFVDRNERGRIYVSACGIGLMVPALAGLGYAGSWPIAAAYFVLFGLGWGFFDANNMPILAQLIGSKYRATGYGLMNFVSISFGGLADWGYGVLRDSQVPLYVSFGALSLTAVVSIGLMLLVQPRASELVKD